MQTQQSHDLKKIPVSVSITVILVLIFSLYFGAALKDLPCGKDMISSIQSQFVHTDYYHLTANILSLYALSRVERQIGSRQFFSLIMFLVIFTAIIEVIVHKLIPNMTCSIGFSGILFGILAWEIVSKGNVDITMLISIGSLVIIPSMKSKRASLSGHVIGAAAGIVGGLLWKKIGLVKNGN